MKTKDLIKELMKLDPTGDIDVCIGNAAIYSIEKLPGYYDGAFERLIQDHSLDPYYNIVGAEYIRNEQKICLNKMAVVDCFKSPKFFVDYSKIGDAAIEKNYKESDLKTLESERKIRKDCERMLFLQWAKDKAKLIASCDIEQDAIHFFNSYYIPNRPLLESLKTKVKYGNEEWTQYESYNDRRIREWNNTIQINFDGMGFEIKEIIP